MKQWKGFFVPPKKNQSKKQKNQKKINSDRLDLVLLSNAKQIGLSFTELNELRVRDFMEMVDIKTDNMESGGVPPADQKDIDKLLA